MTSDNFENNLERLEEIVGVLEQGDLPLEKAIEKFQEGIKLSKLCGQRLREVEEEVKKLVAQQEQFKLEPFSSEDA